MCRNYLSVCEMADLETQIVPEHYLSFKDDVVSED